MGTVKITIRPNGPFVVEAPEGTIELASLPLPSAAAADQSTSRFATGRTAKSDSKAPSWR